MAKSNKGKGGKGTTRKITPVKKIGGAVRESHNIKRKGAGGTIDGGPRKKKK